MHGMTRLLMIDDDEKLVRLMREYLAPEGFELTVAHDGPSGLEAALAAPPALVILDLMLPGIDGLEICRRLRARSQVPVLMLTARGDETDRIVGLELGADDYMPKPFNPRELLARIRAILRRYRPAESVAAADLPAANLPAANLPAEKGPPAAAPSSAGTSVRSAIESAAVATSTTVLSVSGIVIDPGARRVTVRGRDVDLTTVEFDLLHAMVRAAGQALSRDQLLEAVHGPGWAAYDRSVDVHVSRIRQKIEADPSRPALVKTVRGIGYQLCVTDPTGRVSA